MMFVTVNIDRGYFSEEIDLEVELTKEDVLYFIRTNLDFPEYETMSLDEWEDYLRKNVKTFEEEMIELHESELSYKANEYKKIKGGKK